MPSGASETRLLGAWGEQQAAEYLRRKGYKILAVNFKCRFGELDIIAQKGRTVAFVEVKTRKSGDFALAMEYVDQMKQEKLRKTAALWISQQEWEGRVRFDVIEVYAGEGTATRRPRLHHMEDAFS